MRRRVFLRQFVCKFHDVTGTHRSTTVQIIDVSLPHSFDLFKKQILICVYTLDGLRNAVQLIGMNNAPDPDGPYSLWPVTA